MSRNNSRYLVTLAFATSALADGAFHTASLFTSYFTSFKGTIVVPPRIASGGTPYLWPGLQPQNNQGVLQPVLDGRNGHWYFGNAYVGNPGEPYGGGVNCGVGESLGFHMTESPPGSGNWVIGVNNSQGDRADYEYDIGLRMNQALFAAEIYDTNWDFGDLVFNDVEIVAEGTDASWCTANPPYSDVTINFQGVTSTVSDGYVTCTIDSATLSPP